jgi:DNA polymerase-3 subunit chi
MPDILFYHLTRTTVQEALPGLLEKSLERGWRVVVQAATGERLKTLDAHLWTYAEDAFLPHDLDTEPAPERQPILLTTRESNPNGAAIRFLLDGVGFPPDLAAYQRIAVLFADTDPEVVAIARERWKEAKDHPRTYWQQDERGRWIKKA